eukprot:2474088-Pyramimonas_sp.AAC.1
MAISVVRAEWPEWDVCLSTFSVMNAKKPEMRGAVDTCLERLSQSFNIPLAPLSQAYADHFPEVQKLVAGGETNRNAWVHVIKKIEQLRTDARPSNVALKDLVVRYLTFCGMTTSGVEHTHSLQQLVFTSR